MNKVILLLVIIGITSATKADAFQGLWSAFKMKYQKYYTAAEELTRFGIFIENCFKIQRLNAQNTGVKYGINQFADLTSHEFATQYATGTFYDDEEILDDLSTITLPVGGLPESVDWRTKGAVTPVKNQRACGSCWAFSAAGLLEGFYFVNNGKLLSFSEQQLVDCTSLSFGCFGGFPAAAVKYASNKGLELEDDYPYIAKGGKCQYDQNKAIHVANGYRFVPPKSSEQLKAALVNSPVSVVVQSDANVFQLYKSGVVTKDCGAQVNHAVLAVGYEMVDGVEAFIVKNSWGTAWGDEGYIRIATDQSQNDGKGVCGILSQSVIATL